MPIPSKLKRSKTNPISRVPNDILRRVFMHCLPRYPLEEQQPNPTIAPLVLCHICSSWRTVALTSAALWSHLSCCLTMCEVKAKPRLVKREVEFLRLWRKNQGSTIAPFLRLSIEQKSPRKIRQELSIDGITFLLEYLTSAQYLDLDSFYWEQIYERIETGFPFAPIKLHTLVKSKYTEDDPFYRVQEMIQAGTLPRLSINKDEVPPQINIEIPTFWSTLTHISLHHIELSVNSWFSLICGLRKLEWGYIDIAALSEIEEYEPLAHEITLPQLSTFCVACGGVQGFATDFTFRALFKGVHLPAVHTLSLSWVISGPAHKHDLIDELYTVLKSTPGVTMLALAGVFLTLYGARSCPATIVAGYDSIWSHVNHLVELQLEVPSDGTREQMGVYVRDTLFAKSSWLDLRSPKCPIRGMRKNADKVANMGIRKCVEKCAWCAWLTSPHTGVCAWCAWSHSSRTVLCACCTTRASAGDVLKRARRVRVG